MSLYSTGPEMTIEEIVDAIAQHFQGQVMTRPTLTRVLESCQKKLDRTPNDLSLLNTFATASYINGNVPFSVLLWASVLAKNPDNSSVEKNLGATLPTVLPDISIKDFLALLKNGKESLIKVFELRGHACFDQEKYVHADMFYQFSNAIRHPFHASLDPLSTCLAKSQQDREIGRFSDMINTQVQSFAQLWANYNSVSVIKGHQSLVGNADREQIADSISAATTLFRQQSVKILEIGCFTGLNLGNARQKLTKNNVAAALVGLEPNGDAVSYARSIYSDIEFVQGTHKALQDNPRFETDCFDICLCSRMIHILAPQAVGDILTYARKHVKCLVIVDDVVNVEGDSITYRPFFSLLYPFRRLLAEFGFEIKIIEKLVRPDRAVSGILVAVNTAFEEFGT